MIATTYAKAVHAEHADIEGLLYDSPLTGGDVCAVATNTTQRAYNGAKHGGGKTMRCRESAAREHSMQVARVATIVGVEEARRLSAIDPAQADLAQGATLAGAMALAAMRERAWIERDDDDAGNHRRSGR